MDVRPRSCHVLGRPPKSPALPALAGAATGLQETRRLAADPPAPFLGKLRRRVAGPIRLVCGFAERIPAAGQRGVLGTALSRAIAAATLAYQLGESALRLLEQIAVIGGLDVLADQFDVVEAVVSGPHQRRHDPFERDRPL